MLDRYRRGGRELPRHRRRLRRRRLGGDARAVARRPPRRGRARHQGALPGLRPRRPGPRSRPHPRGLRREPAPPRRRRDRPLPDPRARSRRAAGGDARGARRARAGGQGARARRLQLPGLAARVGGRAAGPQRLVAVRLAAAAVLAGRALDRDRDPAVLPRRRARRAAVGAARRRLPDRPLLARRAAAAGSRMGEAADDLEEAPARRAIERNFRAVDEARAIAEAKGATVSQVALAWLLGDRGRDRADRRPAHVRAARGPARHGRRDAHRRGARAAGRAHRAAGVLPAAHAAWTRAGSATSSRCGAP